MNKMILRVDAPQWIPTLTLPFSKGGNTVAPSSTGFPPFEKGRVRVGIHKIPEHNLYSIQPLGEYPS
jgi:hypothetical protein